VETYYPILYLLVSFAIAMVSTLIVFKWGHSRVKMESRLTGVWVNESQTMRILLHHINSVFQGDVVWINSVKSNHQHLLGSRMIKDLALKRIAQGSYGTYVDLKNGKEMPFRVWFQGKGRLKIVVMKKANGREMVLKEEQWYQL